MPFGSCELAAFAMFIAISVPMAAYWWHGVRRLCRHSAMVAAELGCVADLSADQVDSVAAFSGGACVNSLYMSGPFAKLAVAREKMELRVLWMDPVVIPRADVVALRWKTHLTSLELGFRTASGANEEFTFITFRGDNFRGRVAEMGWE